MQTIRVETPTAKYEVVAGSGLVETLAPRIERVIGRLPRRVFVLTSPSIWALWSERFCASFREQPVALFLPPGEKYKTMASVERLTREMAAVTLAANAVLIVAPSLSSAAAYRPPCRAPRGRDICGAAMATCIWRISF